MGDQLRNLQSFRGEGLGSYSQLCRRRQPQHLEDYCCNNFFLFEQLESPLSEKFWNLPLRPPERPDPEDYNEAAQGKFGHIEGLEIQDIAPDDDDGGEWVSAWVWVTDKEAADFDLDEEATKS